MKVCVHMSALFWCISTFGMDYAHCFIKETPDLKAEHHKPDISSVIEPSVCSIIEMASFNIKICRMLILYLSLALKFLSY